MLHVNLAWTHNATLYIFSCYDILIFSILVIKIFKVESLIPFDPLKHVLISKSFTLNLIFTQYHSTHKYQYICINQAKRELVYKR